MVAEPCLCGAPDCRDCYPSTWQNYAKECDTCGEVIAECACENPNPVEDDDYDPREDMDDGRRDDEAADRAADKYERDMEG